LRALLKVLPDAAGKKCDLKDILTFIPNDSIPLELHDRSREIQNIDSDLNNKINWTQSTLDKLYGTKGGMRRSDLMFAFNLNVLPYQYDVQWIRRFESRIRQEVREAEGDDNFEPSQAMKLVWTWMCTFAGPEDKGDNYANSVQRTIQSLPSRSVRQLTLLPTDDGKFAAKDLHPTSTYDQTLYVSKTLVD
jgi:hypothetical protein